MLNNCIVLLTCTRKESRNVNKRHDRNIESIAETNETCCLTACIYVEYTSISCRLISYDTNALTIETCKADDDVLGELRLNLEELAIVGNSKTIILE